MSGRIIIDEQEFLEIVRKLARKDLLGLLKRGQITILGPDRGVAIPIEYITIPKLHFSPIPYDIEVKEGDGEESDDMDVGPDLGVGEGSGDMGKDLGPVDGGQDGDGDGDEEGERSAGTGRGPDIIEIEVPSEEFYELFKEVLELPNIQPKGEKQIKVESTKYSDIRPVGPDSQKHKKRTYKEALKRIISEGGYDPAKPAIIPIRQDMRFRSPHVVTKPKNNALIAFMMDVSGSMTREDRAVVRYFCALCEFWLNYNYEEVDTLWIIHDGEANRVEKDVFFKTQRGGGTVISTAHNKLLEIIDEEYPPSEWNIYPMYFSDGFNIGDFNGIDDDDLCAEIILDKILPIVNQYTYCEVNAGRFWWPSNGKKTRDPSSKFNPAGSFGVMLNDFFHEEPLVVCTNLRAMDEVPESIKKVFGQGN